MRETYVDILEKQLAVDYDCTLSDIQSSNNIYREYKVNKGARPIGNAETLLKVAVYREKLLVMANRSKCDNGGAGKGNRYLCDLIVKRGSIEKRNCSDLRYCRESY